MRKVGGKLPNRNGKSDEKAKGGNGWENIYIFTAIFTAPKVSRRLFLSTFSHEI